LTNYKPSSIISSLMADIPNFTAQQFYFRDLPGGDGLTYLPESSRRARLAPETKEEICEVSLKGKLEKDALINAFEATATSRVYDGGHYTLSGNWVQDEEHPFDVEK